MNHQSISNNRTFNAQAVSKTQINQGPQTEYESKYPGIVQTLAKLFLPKGQLQNGILRVADKTGDICVNYVVKPYLEYQCGMSKSNVDKLIDIGIPVTNEMNDAFVKFVSGSFTRL